MYNKNQNNRRHGSSSKPSFLAYCPLCEKKYDPFRARLIEAKEDIHLLHTQCSQCGSYIVSLISSTPFGLSAVGVISDLSSADVFKFKNQPKITCDDIIEFHQVIAKKNNQ